VCQAERKSNVLVLQEILMTANPLKLALQFTLMGETIPRDHGYALFGALCHLLGDLHGAEWLSILPIAGIDRGDGLLQLRPQATSLRLRVSPDKLPALLPLCGKTITIGAHKLQIGVCQVQVLVPSSSLYSRMVVFSDCTEEDTFLVRANLLLAKEGLKAKIQLGRRRITQVTGKKIIGFETMLLDLTDSDALRLLSDGLGGRQRFGCGVFVPARAGIAERSSERAQ
jgi:CRISPR-associated protein Cas6